MTSVCEAADRKLLVAEDADVPADACSCLLVCHFVLLPKAAVVAVVHCCYCPVVCPAAVLPRDPAAWTG